MFRPSLKELYSEALSRLLRDAIEKPPVRHVEKPNRFYLIEGKYYTQKFYEVAQLTSAQRNPVGLSLATAAIRELINKEGAPTLLNLSAALDNFCKALQAELPTLRCVSGSQTPGPNEILAASREHEKGRPLLLLTDVVCTGKQFLRSFSLIGNIQDVRIFAFVDGREKQLPYITDERTSGAHSVPIRSLLQTPITPIYDLPSGEDIEVFTVDRRWHSPVPPDNVGQIELDPLRLIERASRCGSLLHGHVEIDGKHYVDFLNLPRLFAEVRDELERFWNGAIAEIKAAGLTTDDITVFYLFENRGWEDAVPRFLATKGIGEVKRISRAELFTPGAIGEAYIRGKCAWFILPVVASGETTRRCLEFAARLRPALSGDGRSKSVALIAISAAVGRMAPQELLFYRNVRRYKDAKVQMSVMSFLPLPAYPTSTDCPICRAVDVAERRALRFDQHARLRSAFERTTDQLRVQHIERQATDQGGFPTSAERWRDLAQMRALYSHALKDVLQRKLLAEMLATDDGRIAFVEMVGAHCDSEGFSLDEVQSVLYKNFDALKDTITTRLRRPLATGLSLPLLLGAHVLFPELVAEEIKWLTRAAVEQRIPSLLDQLVFLCLLDQQRYGAELCIGAELATGHDSEQQELIKEIRTYPYWFGTDTGRAISALEQLLWLLRRSTHWGTGIEEMRARLMSSDIEGSELPASARKFELQGINPVLALLATLHSADNGEGLWTAIIVEQGKPDLRATALADAASKFRSLFLLTKSHTREEFLSALRRLDACGQDLRKSLECVYTNARDVVRRLRRDIYEARRWPELTGQPVSVELSVADDQPGILFGLEDLVSSIGAVLENAATFFRQHGAPADGATYNIAISFDGWTADKDSAVLTIRDNIPYVNSAVPAGGLKLAQETANKYGARFDMSVLDQNDLQAKLRFYFRVDSSRRSQ